MLSNSAYGRSVLFRASRLGALFLAALLPWVFFGGTARAQLGGTYWLDFVPNTPPGGYPTSATIGPETSFADAITTLPGLGGLTNAQVTQVETDTTTLVNSKFAGLSFNIYSNAGDPTTLTPSAPPGGSYTSIVIGAAAGANAGVLGQASEIDWRNLNFSDSIGVSATAFDYGDDYTVNANTDTIALALANTIAHEIGHTVGLVHDDAAATYANTAGTVAQKQTAVQNNDLMRANVTSFASATSTTTAFNSWSQLKLQVATHGVLLENQAATTAMGSPGVGAGGDPISRTADANDTNATATPLITSNNMVDVLGNITGSNDALIDTYSFMGAAGQHVSFEIYSLGLEQSEGDTDSGRIMSGNTIGNNTITLYNAANPNAALDTSMDPTTGPGGATNYDGSGNNSAYGDALIYNFTLPASGLTYVDVTGSSTGQYELFAVVPEPSSIMLFLGIAGACTLRRQRRSVA